MRSFFAFFRKELLESARSGKLMILGILFFVFGVMNPAVAKLTPFLMEMLSEEFAGSGMTVTAVTVDALTSWTQFFKNIPMALIAFVLIYSGIFTKEYESGTLILVLTKGIARYKILLSKALVLLLVWACGYWLCFGITYAYNAYFWDNGIAVGLFPCVINWFVFGLFTISLVVFLSVLSRSSGTVLLFTGGSIFFLYLLGLVPKIAKYLPTSLINSGKLLVGAEKSSEYFAALIITFIISGALTLMSIPVFNKKQL